MTRQTEVVRGSVVKALAGRERDRLFVAEAVADRCVYIADGKERKLSKPKCKNRRHISPTGQTLDMTDMTDKKLRKALAALKPEAPAGKDPTKAERREG